MADRGYLEIPLAELSSNPRKGRQQSAETCAKISRAMRGKQKALGIHPSEETRRKIREALKGRKPSTATIEAGRQVNRGNKYRLGKCHSAETKRKISDAQKGKKIGPESHRWRGGEFRDKDGYIRTYAPGHPASDVKGYVLKHRLVTEKALGRSLSQEEIVHHKNNIRDDNRPENLFLFSSQKDHREFHIRGGSR